MVQSIRTHICMVVLLEVSFLEFTYYIPEELERPDIVSFIVHISIWGVEVQPRSWMGIRVKAAPYNLRILRLLSAVACRINHMECGLHNTPDDRRLHSIANCATRYMY